MTENLKTQQELLTDFADNNTQDITPEMYRNFVVSVLSVGTGEANTGVDPQANGSARDVEVGKGLTRLGNRRCRRINTALMGSSFRPRGR